MVDSPQDKLRVALPAQANEMLLAAARIAEVRGWQLFLVGGYARDTVLNRGVFDVDVSVVGDAIRLGGELATSTGAELEAHEQFGTATVRLPGGFDLDLVTARKEVYTSPGALPTVEPGTIYDDLARRDFTVNALAVRFTAQGAGDLLDSHNGLSDLRSRLIRVMHNLSFRDDPTRLFRAVKFAHRLGFDIEKQTLELILQAVRDGALYTVSMDRIARELLLIMEEQNADSMLWDLDRYGVLGAIHPLLSWPYEPGKIRPKQDERLTKAERRDTYLAVLGAETGTDPAEAEKVARWLNLPAPHVKLMREASRLAALWPRLGADEQSRWQTYSLLRDIDTRSLEAYSRIEALQADTVAWQRLTLYLDNLRYIKPELKGDYLESLGAAPGPLYREVLEQLLEAKVEGEVPTRADEEEFVRERLAERE